MIKKAEIKESLINQLKNKKADTEYFLSLVDDYIWYWDQEKAMQRDIKVKGRTYESTSASGFNINKENPSVKNAMLYNKQKLTILKEMGLSTDNIISDDKDEL